MRPRPRKGLQVSPGDIVDVDTRGGKEPVFCGGGPSGVFDGGSKSFILDAKVADVSIDLVHPVGQDVVFGTLLGFPVGTLPAGD